MKYFIPARKGSERIKGKNKRLLLGRPLINWTFDLFDSRMDEVIVSSDDEEVLKTSELRGFVAIKRSPKLCGIASKMSDVLFSHSDDFGDGLVCVLYPTSPFRLRKHVNEAIKEWKRINKKTSRNDFVVMSVSPVKYRPLGLMKIVRSGNLVFNDPNGRYFYRDQGMPVHYRANGAIYVIPSALIHENKLDAQLFGPRTYPYIMDEISGFEIDTETDLYMAENLAKIVK